MGLSGGAEVVGNEEGDVLLEFLGGEVGEHRERGIVEGIVDRVRGRKGETEEGFGTGDEGREERRSGHSCLW